MSFPRMIGKKTPELVCDPTSAPLSRANHPTLCPFRGGWTLIISNIIPFNDIFPNDHKNDSRTRRWANFGAAFPGQPSDHTPVSGDFGKNLENYAFGNNLLQKGVVSFWTPFNWKSSSFCSLQLQNLENCLYGWIFTSPKQNWNLKHSQKTRQLFPAAASSHFYFYWSEKELSSKSSSKSTLTCTKRNKES